MRGRLKAQFDDHLSVDLLLSQLSLNAKAYVSRPVSASLGKELVDLQFDLLKNDLTLLRIATDQEGRMEGLNECFDFLRGKKKSYF